jgi:hypothetical protein
MHACQITEKLYRQLEPRTKKLRFTVPFPLLAFPVYLVRLHRYIDRSHVLYLSIYDHRSEYILIGICGCSCTGAPASRAPTSFPAATCSAPRRRATSWCQPPAGASCSPPSSPWRARSAHSRCSRCTASHTW